MSIKKIALAAEAPLSIPFDKLDRDPANVRRTDAGSGIEELANDIAAHGLLQNLGVRPALDANDAPTGRYLVTFGGRRLAALALLVKAKRLNKTSPVPCRLVADEDATSVSLAENLSRLAMNPVDAYEAFAQLADEGRSDDEIARRFGISTLTVQRRLRLGRLAPVVREAFRHGKINAEAAQAYAITTDHAAQERAFARFVAAPGASPYAIRSALTEGDVPAYDDRVEFVGLDAYEAAGGEVRRDLFSEGSKGATVIDAALLDRLVVERLQSVGDALTAEGWSIVRVSVDEPDDLRAYYPAPFDEEPRSAEDAAKLSALIDEAEALETKGELTEEESDRHDEITSEIERLEEPHHVYSDATKQAATVLVYLDGEVVTFHGLPRDASTAMQVEGLDRDGDGGDGGDDALVPMPKPREVEAPALSAALIGELQAHRTAGLRAQVTERPGLALRLTVHSLLLSRSHASHRAVAKIRGEGPSLKAVCPTIEDTPARRAVADAIERIGDHQPGENNRLWSWLLGLEDADVLAILAPLVAETVDAGTGDWSEGNVLPYAAEVAQAADLDMRAYWTATPETYFGRVTKPQIGVVVREVGAGPFSTDGKKADVARAAARLVGDSGWLPSMLRVPPMSEAQASEGDTGDADAAMELPQAAE